MAKELAFSAGQRVYCMFWEPGPVFYIRAGVVFESLTPKGRRRQRVFTLDHKKRYTNRLGDWRGTIREAVIGGYMSVLGTYLVATGIAAGVLSSVQSVPDLSFMDYRDGRLPSGMPWSRLIYGAPRTITTRIEMGMSPVA